MTTINKHEVLINAYIPELFQRYHKAKAIQRYHKAKAIQRSQSYSKAIQRYHKAKAIQRYHKAKAIQRYHKPILKLFKDIKKAIQEPPKTNPKLSQR
jgi:hypothetical protein